MDVCLNWFYLKGQVSSVLKKQWIKPVINVFKYANPERVIEEQYSDQFRLRLEQIARATPQSEMGNKKLDAA